MVISVLSAIYSGNKEEKKKMVLSLKKRKKDKSLIKGENKAN